MKLLAAYVGIVIIGELIAYAIGLGVERMTSPATSLIVFLVLFFSVFFFGWKAAIRLT